MVDERHKTFVSMCQGLSNKGLVIFLFYYQTPSESGFCLHSMDWVKFRLICVPGPLLKVQHRIRLVLYPVQYIVGAQRRAVTADNNDGAFATGNYNVKFLFINHKL